MATTKDLRVSITEMDDEAAFALVKEARFQRRQPPLKKQRVATSRKTPIKQPPSAVASKLTPTQAAELLKLLEGD